MLNASTHTLFIAPITLSGKSVPSLPIQSTGLVIRPITEHDEQLATDLLVRRMYAWRGYLVKRQFSNVRNPDHATLAAWQDGELVATLTLSRDKGCDLLCEALYPTEIAELRAKSQRVCEFSRLAIDPEFSSPALLDTFLRTAYNFARSHFGATAAVVEINPRHRRYYERELGFAQVGERRVCPRVDAPAILLQRDLRHSLPGTVEAAIAA
jgi:hypothetical protein